MSTHIASPPGLAAYGTAAARGKIYDNVLQTVGGTPLVRVPRLAAEEGLVADLVLKLEFFNPLGSVKDRIGLGMIDAAEKAGEITPGKTVLVEPTSGNTGIALAFVAAARGYRLIVTMPESASIERRRMLRLMDAQVELTPPKLGMAGAISRAKEILADTPDALNAVGAGFIARQYCTFSGFYGDHLQPRPSWP
jgi:cysteine synthase A